MLQPLWDQMIKVPDVVWSAIIASIMTQFGVLLVNRNSRHQQRDALRNDALQRDREREMSLRREVYLPAAEAITNRFNILSRFTYLDISMQDILTELTKDTAAIAKIEVVGTNATVQAIYTFSQEFGAAILELELKRVSIDKRKKDIEYLSECLYKTGKEQENDVDDKHVDLTTELNRGIYKKQDHLLAEQNREILELVESCLKHYMEISRLIPPALFAVRDELELHIDKVAYMKTFDENLKKTDDLLKASIARMKSEMNA